MSPGPQVSPPSLAAAAVRPLAVPFTALFQRGDKMLLRPGGDRDLKYEGVLLKLKLLLVKGAGFRVMEKEIPFYAEKRPCRKVLRSPASLPGS